jgi:hypothetical protein
MIVHPHIVGVSAPSILHQARRPYRYQSPMTFTSRSPPWSPPPSTTPAPHHSSNHRGHRCEELPMTAAGGHPDRVGHDGRRCDLFGCLELAAWIITDPQGGQLAACDVDVDVLINHALAQVSPGSSTRIGIWRA